MPLVNRGGGTGNVDPLSGKKIGIFGSSTSDRTFIGAGTIYYDVIAARTGLIISTQAKAGTQLVPATATYTADPSYNMLRQIDALPADLDIVIGMIGANDERNSVTVGTFSSVATWDFYSSLHKMCQKMIDKWNTARFGIMTSQYFGNPSVTDVVTLQSSAYHTAIQEVCAYYGIPFIDMAKEGGVPYSYKPAKVAYVQGDNLHLNAAGNLKFSYPVEAFLRRVHGANKQSTVVTPPVTYTDNFDRADNATVLGGSWVAAQGVWGIVSNHAAVITASSATSSSGARDVAYWEFGKADGILTVKNLTANSPTGLAFRVQDALNHLMLVSTSSGYKLYKVVNGTSSQIGTAAGPVPAANDVLTAVFTGDTISCRVNGTEFVNAQDATYQTNTKHGLCSRSYTGSLFDDFSFE